MALFENEELEEINFIEDANKYLDNSELGISLIKLMLDRNTEKQYLDEFEKIVDDKILPILAELELNNGMEIYAKLKRVSNQLQEQKKIKLIEGKKVLGVGGKFSAGKSCFINSISGAKLPEGQRPTTSIATYIINAEESKNLAITGNDNLVDLDDEALAALTHQFYDRYQVGFSKLVKNLIIYSSEFAYKNIAILDTPGYSKADEAKADEASDAELAREQLKTADYLIWLVDSVQGVITQRDIEFISSLKIDSEVLVVYTKADCEEFSNLNKKIAAAKADLEFINKKIYDVIAYDSISGETIIGGNALNDYLNMIERTIDSSNDIEIKIDNIYENLNKQLKSLLLDTEEKIVELDDVLTELTAIEHISSIINEKSILQSKYEKIDKNLEIINIRFSELRNLVSNMRKVE